MSDFSERVNFTIDYIGDKLNQKAWGEDQIKEFLEIRISEFKAEFERQEKIINKFERLKSEGKINSGNAIELKDDIKSFRLNMKSLREDIHFLKILKIETPETLKKLKVLKSDKVIEPIHWLKGEKSLSRFLESLKGAGLIENRESDEIIQEHFRQTDQAPQSIQWSKSNRLLIYLFNKLTEAGLVDTMGRQFKLITEHFLDRHGQKFKRDSLKQDFQNMKYSSDPRGSKTIDKIIQEVSD